MDLALTDWFVGYLDLVVGLFVLGFNFLIFFFVSRFSDLVVLNKFHTGQ